jgi:hypothetical protein
VTSGARLSERALKDADDAALGAAIVARDQRALRELYQRHGATGVDDAVREVDRAVRAVERQGVVTGAAVEHDLLQAEDRRREEPVRRRSGR